MPTPHTGYDKNIIDGFQEQHILFGGFDDAINRFNPKSVNGE
jgi:hypothetical protein